MIRLILILALVFMSCGDDIHYHNTPEMEEQEAEQPPEAQPEPEPARMNPTCSGVQGFRNGSLWKPVADHNPNCVILFSSRFERAFQSCKAELRNGGLDNLRFTSFANGDRQHWRCNNPSRRYKDNARVICEDGNQQCVFQINGSPTRRHE